ncbi:MAG: hypothetical protein B7Z02_08490 [Rhodobacterales bacterium 32-67-9]|nr:MAG: hypothetical protein B7Z02_08490 [Rhodobacterales bacterium 32-67-9]
MPDTPPLEGTAAQLVAAGLKLFGRKGFAATSTREIAAEAGTNVASIAYHFGGKDGLRRACGAEVARQIGRVLGDAAPTPPQSTDAAIRQMEAILRAMTAFVAGSRASDDLTAFMLREAGEGGPVLDAVYGTLIDPMHRRFCALWATATGQEAESEATRLIVFSLIGQVLYFRVGRPIVTRRMGWDAIDAAEAGRIADILVANLHSILARERLS